MNSASQRSAPNAAESHSGPGGNGQRQTYAGTPADAFKSAGARLAELREYAAYYVSAKSDGVKLKFKNVAIYAALGVVAGIVGLGVLVTSAVLLLVGLSGAIGAMFGPRRLWAGELIVGVVVLTAVFVGVWLAMKKITGASRAATIRKYEERKRNERAALDGHDVQERARA